MWGFVCLLVFFCFVLFWYSEYIQHNRTLISWTNNHTLPRILSLQGLITSLPFSEVCSTAYMWNILYIPLFLPSPGKKTLKVFSFHWFYQNNSIGQYLKSKTSNWLRRWQVICIAMYSLCFSQWLHACWIPETYLNFRR